jgi:endoglucanase
METLSMEHVDIKKIIGQQRELCEIIAVSGFEEPLADYIRGRISKKVDKIWTDPLGSVLAVIEGKGKLDKNSSVSSPGPIKKSKHPEKSQEKRLGTVSHIERERIMLDAHMDEVGFMINHINKNGFCNFAGIGGWDNRIFLGQAVKVRAESGRVYNGIIGSKPPHLLSKDERNKVLELKDMYLDLGFSSQEDAIAMGIKIGSVGTLYAPFEEMPNGLIRGKAFDDRTGINILLHLIDIFSAEPADDSLMFSFSVQEEVGLRGAGPASFALDPTMAIVVENTTAGDVPGIPENECPAYLGQGPAITIADNSLLASPRVNERLVQNARNENIPFQWKKPIFGGTDGGRIHQSRSGIPTSVVSVPCRYIHSPTSLLNVSDVSHAIELLTAFIRNGSGV